MKGTREAIHRISTGRGEAVELDLADRDDLTGLANRRFLARLLKTQWDGLLKEAVEIALVIVDLDLFKQVNDSYGHAAGDTVLRSAARLLRENFREGDIVVRYGGDEFVVVLPGAGAAEAAVLAERTRETLSSEDLLTGSGGEPIEVPVTFSIGIASAPRDGVEGQELLDLADRRLYREKRRRHSRALAKFSGRDWLVGAIAVAALAVAVVAIAVRRSDTTLPVTPLPRTEASVLPPEGDRRSTALQIEALEAQITLLSRSLAEVEATDEQPGVEARVAKLEATIDRLQREQEERQEDATSAAEAIGIGAVDETADELLPTGGPSLEEELPNPEGDLQEPKPEPTTVLESPRLVTMPKASYPEAGRIARRGATVLVEVLVGTDGAVQGATILGEEFRFGFEAAAMEAALEALFEPGTRDGEPVPMKMVISVRFLP